MSDPVKRSTFNGITLNRVFFISIILVAAFGG